jgi:flagellar L-ring protein precursor FlgH
MTANPSLWPDEGQGNLFTDFRAFQAMDVITILVNESSTGSKKTKSDAEGKYSLLAGIANLFGVQSKWASNTTGLDPESLIEANTESKFEGKGEMTREGNLKAALSAVIMEVLPNGLMRIEGSKIVSVDDEEEVMVISGLVRARDINSQNQVESNRIANMRIDFYGRGVIAQTQSPGWGARLVSAIWPF